MSQARSIAYHYFFRTLILLGFSSYIVLLTKSDALQYYIAPRMMIYVKAASVALYVIACFQGYMALRAYWGMPVSCECKQPFTRSAFRHTFSYGLMVLPLLVGFLLPDTALSSSMVAAKGMILSASKSTLVSSGAAASSGIAGSGDASASAAGSGAASPGGPAAVAELELPSLFHADNEWDEDFAKIGMALYRRDTIVVKPEIYMEILSSIDLFKQNFIGKKIELTGFIYREDTMSSNQFIVGRFAVSCCSADATPYGVMVDFPAAGIYPKDMWVKVSGTIQNGSYNGNDIFQIRASQVEKIDAPSSPYIYPNFEPLKELD